MARILSAHQINLCPYAGIFQKMEQSDVFVLMRNVQFQKNGYINRFYYKERWHTMRINQSLKPIADKVYLYPHEDWTKITERLPQLKVFDYYISDKLWITNEGIIKKAVELLGIKTKIEHDWQTDLRGTDRLIDMCINLNCDTYLSGISGRNYLELDKFEKAGINIIFQESPDKRALCELL